MMQALVRAVGFAHLFVVGSEGPMVAHAPLVVTPEGAVHFHIARTNRVTPHLDGAALLGSVVADDFYVSPDWYEAVDGVPTWDYVAVEIEGVARPLGTDELVAQLDALSAVHEAALAPKRPWTRAKMTPGRFEAMLPAIRGFAIDAPVWRGTRKLSQNRSPADRAGVAAALDALGRPDRARAVADSTA